MKEYIKDAIQKIFETEGAVSFDPYGGDTLYGIAMKKQPMLFLLWSAFDEWDKELPVPPELMEMVVGFYEDYWNDSGAGLLHVVHKSLGIDLFDMAVNCGKSAAILTLQRALNFLNRNQKDYPDIEVDGGFGMKTHMALGALLHARDRNTSIRLLSVEFNILRGQYYNDLYLKNPEKEKYLGWLLRCFANPV